MPVWPWPSCGSTASFICKPVAKRKTVETKPFEIEGDTLELNIDAHRGSIKVEILDETGQALPAFSGANAKLYRGHDRLRLQPGWKQSSLGSLKGQTVRLRFTLQNTKLYAFQIR